MCSSDLGAFVHLVREGLIGEQSLEITAGDSTKPLLTEGQMVDYQTAATVEQLLRDIKPAVENANILLRELAQLAIWLNDPNSDIRQVTTRLNDVSQDLNRENVGKLISNLASALENLKGLSQDLKDQKVAKQLASALEVAATILSDLQPLSDQVRPEERLVGNKSRALSELKQ